MGSRGPPKCRTCGKAEWRHVCGGLPKDLAARKVLRVGGVEVVPDEPTREPQTVLVNYDLAMKAVDAGIAMVVPAATEAKKPTSEKRKAYLAEKARERRAAEKAGLTVKEYREKFGK